MRTRELGESTAHSGEDVMSRVRTVSHLLDEAFRVPGTNVRVGVDPILGILPVGGDAVASLLSLYIVFEGYRNGASPRLLARMLALVAVDAVVGSVPVVGPLFDSFWKANTWNARLLADHLDVPDSAVDSVAA